MFQKIMSRQMEFCVKNWEVDADTGNCKKSVGKKSVSLLFLASIDTKVNILVLQIWR